MKKPASRGLSVVYLFAASAPRGLFVGILLQAGDFSVGILHEALELILK